MKKYVEDLDFRGRRIRQRLDALVSAGYPPEKRRSGGGPADAEFRLDRAGCRRGPFRWKRIWSTGRKSWKPLPERLKNWPIKINPGQKLFYMKPSWSAIRTFIFLIGNTRCHETPLDGACGLCGGGLDCSYFYDKKKHKYGLVDITDRSSSRMIDGPLCSARVNDLGYAVGSALWTARTLDGGCQAVCQYRNGRSENGVLPQIRHGGRCARGGQIQKSLCGCKCRLPPDQYGQSAGQCPQNLSDRPDHPRF